MQNDFCLPDAVLCVNGAMGCLPKVIEAVNAARACGIPVVWVIREHDPKGKARGWKGHGMHINMRALGHEQSRRWPRMSQAKATSQPRTAACCGICAGIDVELFRAPMFKDGKSSTVKGTAGGCGRQQLGQATMQQLSCDP